MKVKGECVSCAVAAMVSGGRSRAVLLVLLLALQSLLIAVRGQTVNEIDADGNITSYDESSPSKNFNKHSKDTAQAKEIPRGIYVWTVDRRFGERARAEVDTLPHLFMNTIFNTGLYGDYNTTGNNYTARLNRIFADRPLTAQFVFTQPYDYVVKEPDELHFTNTLSPITNISYDNCGDKTNGEDHIDAKFAVNAGKRLGLGFDLNYAYARGYYASQNTSHFGATLYGSYIGDKYQMHLMFSTYHQKVSENGGITDDNYITHPESFDDSYSTSEIPTQLESNWSRNNSIHLFYTHRYNIGFYRRVALTDDELKARRFAAESKAEYDKIEADSIATAEGRTGRQAHGRPEGARVMGGEPPAAGGERSRPERQESAPQGRPEGAPVMGDEPPRQSELPPPADSLRLPADSLALLAAQGAAARDSMMNDSAYLAQRDSLREAKRIQDSLDTYTRLEYIPVTSFIHTLDVNSYDRTYLAYETPEGYYADTYYEYADEPNTYSGDSIYDQTTMVTVRNTLAIALLEGFNKYAKAGLRVFAAHELRSVKLPEVVTDGEESYYTLNSWKENTVSIGGELSKTQGRTLHYNLGAELWVAGEDAGQLKVDFSTDVNIPLWGDTLTIAARAYFYRLNATFYQRHYHSKHLWWDNDLSEETRTRVEGLFTFPKTKTSVRVAVEEVQNYTYFGTSYTLDDDYLVQGVTASVRQASGNINLLMAQLRQDFRLGPLNWENIVTWQHTSDEAALPLPSLNIFTNLYLKFKIAHELAVEFGGDCYFFTKYYAPEYCPSISNYAVNENADTRVEVGGYPYVDVYANMHLKRTRFFIMYSHVNAGGGDRNYFLTPHYPTNGRILRFGLSWNFYN